MQSGPALLLLLGIVLGVLYNNRSISHLDTRISDSTNHLSSRIDDLSRHEEARHNDLKVFSSLKFAGWKNASPAWNSRSFAPEVERS